MKKFLLITLTVLSVISLVACSANSNKITEEEAEKRTQAKLDETAETYAEYLKYYEALYKNLWEDIIRDEYESYSTESKENADITEFKGADVAYFARHLYSTDEYKISESTSKSKFTSGKLSGTKDNCTISDVKMTAVYDIRSRVDGTTVKANESTEITISTGSYKETITGDDASYTQTVSMKATVNGTEYSIEYTIARKDGKTAYTSASVNGKAVAPKFLTALETYGNVEWY